MTWSLSAIITSHETLEEEAEERKKEYCTQILASLVVQCCEYVSGCKFFSNNSIATKRKEKQQVHFLSRVFCLASNYNYHIHTWPKIVAKMRLQACKCIQVNTHTHTLKHSHRSPRFHWITWLVNSSKQAYKRGVTLSTSL